MTTPANPATFDDLCGSLPSHHSEVMTAHEGRPTVAEQDRTHGAGLPPADHGVAEGPNKYGGGI
jgi:hypothetical protein